VVDLSIIIVSWNVADLLDACLKSIYSHLDAASQPNATTPSTEVIVVDSGSTDGTPARVRQNFPQVELIALDENVGFTRANNIGLERARGRYLFLLNPDTVVIGDALARLVAFMDATSDAGMCGPHTLNSDGTTQSTRRRFPNFWIGLFESTWLQPYAPKRLLDSYYIVNGNGVHETLDVDWVQGSALMARREVYEQIGGLDEGFVMFSEELDWCRRARDAGWRVVYVGEAEIIHHGGKSTEQVVARTHILFQQSKLRYFRKYHGPVVAGVLRLFLQANYVAQLAVEGAKWLLGHKRDLRQERIAAYWTVLKSGLKVSL
jgi:N-acetylglucosaminyl-diphospho-decaprenol L-rhamnosyltransferase